MPDHRAAARAAITRALPPRPLLDYPGAAEYLGTTERHVRNLVYRRALPFVKLGGRLTRFNPDDLDEYVRSCTVPAA